MDYLFSFSTLPSIYSMTIHYVNNLKIGTGERIWLSFNLNDCVKKKNHQIFTGLRFEKNDFTDLE